MKAPWLIQSFIICKYNSSSFSQNNARTNTCWVNIVVHARICSPPKIQQNYIKIAYMLNKRQQKQAKHFMFPFLRRVCILYIY